MPTNGSLSLVPSHGTLVLLLGFLVQLQRDGFYFIFTIFYFVMFGCYLLYACSFLMRDRKEVGLDRREDGEKLGGTEGGKIVIRI